MTSHYFTVDEVNQLIPQLEDLLTQLRDAHSQMVRVERELGQTVRRTTTTDGFNVSAENQARALQERADGVVSRFHRLAQDVADMGAEVKDPETGLVDFRGLRDGREVYLCWRLGEPACTWWHDLESGFRGRQPLD